MAESRNFRQIDGKFSKIRLVNTNLQPEFHIVSYVGIFIENKCLSSTMLQKLSKCEVKAWHCWNLTILPPLRFYMKSNFGEFKRFKMSFLAILVTLNFEFWLIWDLKAAQIHQKSKFRTSKIAKSDSYGPFKFATIWFHVKSEWW